MIFKALAFLSGMMSLLVLHSSSQAYVLALAASCIFLLSKILDKNLGFFSYLIFGLLWSSLSIIYWQTYGASLVREPLKASVKGTICSIPVEFIQSQSSLENGQKSSQKKTYQFDFCIAELAQIEHYSKHLWVTEKHHYKRVSWLQNNKFKLSWSYYVTASEIEPKAGQNWQLELKLRPIHSKYNPLSNDRAKWLLANGYAGTASLRNAFFAGEADGLAGNYYRLRHRLYDHLRDVIGDKSNAGLMIAIILGHKSLIQDQQWEDFKQTGTSHLLAISGLHVGIAALWSYWLILYLWKCSDKLCHWLPAQKAAQLASVCGAFSLMLVSGMGLPAQRAFIMLFVFVMCRLLGKNYSLLSVLAVALFVISGWQPFSILAPGFWLSFFAVFIIAIVITRQFVEISRLLSWLKVNGYLFIALLPISLVFFGFYSVISFLANLILIPLTSFVITPVVYLASVVSGFSERIGELLFSLANLLFTGMQLIQSKLASLRLVFEIGDIKTTTVIVLMLIVLITIKPQKLMSKVILVPLALIFGLGFWFKSEKPTLRMSVLDIGQGLSIVIETPDQVIVYDTGWGNKQYSIARSTLIPFLKNRGIHTIDKLIISHADSDHAGGLNDLLERFTINQLLVGESIQKRLRKPLDNRLSVVNCHQSPGWNWSNIDFQFIPHIKSSLTRGNNASCVLSISYEETNILLTGDIEKQAERFLVMRPIEQYDVLIAPHHGSKTSSTNDFIEMVSPAHVVFSTGYDNQWHFPKDEVVARYLDHNARVWITHAHGAIIFELYPKKTLEVQAWRRVEPHFWLEN